MKTVLVLTAVVVAILASKADVKLLKQKQSLQQSTTELLEFQKDILRLFRNIDQHDYYKDQEDIAVHYDIENNIDSYNNPQAVREFWELNKLGFLPKDEIFSIFNERHRREAISLFKILYYANDFATLYKTASWARIFMNGRLFIYSLSVALVQRPDTASIELPPIYEIYPHYFYKADVIQEAQKARQLYRGQLEVPNVEEAPMNLMDMQQKEPIDVHQYPMEYQNVHARSRRTALDEPEEMYTAKVMPEIMFPPWYNLLPEGLRSISPYMMDVMRQEQLRQEQLRQEQLRQSQFRPQPMIPVYPQEHLNAEQMIDQQIKPERFGMEGWRPGMDNLGQQNAMDFNQFIGITVDTNYSKPTSGGDQDLVVSYFTEDIGLNAYYYYYNIYYPFWLPNEIINLQTERRGEQFYHMIRQILARYYLERLSNGLGHIPIVDYSVPIPSGYNPSMAYLNGLSFPTRPHNIWLRMEHAMKNTRIDNNYTNSYTFIEDYERRIRDAIDLGYVVTPKGKHISLYDENGLDILGNIIEGNIESPNSRFYGSLQILARLFLGNAHPVQVQNDYQIVPSVLEHFETSLRDPVFYQFWKRMIMYFQRYLNNVAPYTMKELLMPGVKVEGIDVSELITYFENYYVDISNAVYNREVRQDMKRIPVRVRQMRLNNKPFTYTINVNSDRPYDALVKVFLGPKHDEMGHRLDITENHLHFVEIDTFPAVLTPGMNRIQRSSLENFYSRDRTTYRQIYMRIMMNINRPGLPEYEPREPEWGMPRRLLLPKGRINGQMYQLYVIVMPYKPITDKYSKSVEHPTVSWRRIVDSRPLGYPLDRPIDENVFYVPNSFFKDVIIAHVGMKTDM